MTDDRPPAMTAAQRAARSRRLKVIAAIDWPKDGEPCSDCGAPINPTKGFGIRSQPKPGGTIWTCLGCVSHPSKPH